MLDQDKTKEQLISELGQLRQRIRTDELLKESENQFSNLSESATDAIVLVNNAGTIIFWNSSASMIFGYEKDEAIGMPFINIVGAHEAHAQAIERFQLNDCSSLNKNVFESKGIRKNGQLFPVEIAVSFCETTEGGLYGAIIRDISQRKKTEELLRRSEQQYRSVVETSSDAIITVDNQNKIISWNKGAEIIFGYTAAEILNNSLFTLVPERLHAAHSQKIMELSSSKPNTVMIAQNPSWGKRKDGSEFFAEAFAAKWETEEGSFMTLTLRDITQRHMIENALRRSEEQYRSVIETASDAIITTDLQGTIITWNKGAENIYGYSADEIINKSFIVLFPEHFTLVNQNRMLEHFAQHNMGIIFQDTQIAATRKNGSEFIAEGAVSKWESNEGIFLTAIVRDITERKKAEEALCRSEIQYRSVIETAYDAIITSDSTGIVVGWNNGAEQIFGYSANEIINKPYLTLMPERLHAKYLQRLKGFDENSNNVQRGESFGRRKDGSEFPAEGSLSMWKTDEGVFFTTTARDISDRKLAEDLINKVNNCLLSFTPDPDKNIQTIVETVGLILNADGAAYHKIAGRYVTIKSQWNIQSIKNSLPPIKAPNFRAMFAQNSDKSCIYIPLHKQSFESKESFGMHYQFETSIAVPIKDYNTFMGSLNVSFKIKRILNQNEERALTILAKAIGIEEYRKRYLAKLNTNQRKLTAAKKRLDSFSQKILSIREEEKKSLSNNLHDEIGSMVVALSSCLTISKEEIIGNNPDQALQRINQAETALRQSVDNLKKIAVDLRPPQFEIIGLSRILKELCTSFYHQTAIDLDCRFNIKDKHVSDNAAIAIYRVCQEALNNIVKHAKAKRVKIEIGSEKKKITVSISDDGRGFDFRKYNDSYKKEIKLGLISMRERIEALGGTFIIESTQNQGTTIHATLPSR